MKIAIIICDRYRNCAGGKCFRSMERREGAFDIYSPDESLEIAGYTTCGGCPGGNIEYTPEEMIKNGVEVIHFATGLIVGYPPCPYLGSLKSFIEEKYKLKVITGTHPVPQKYFDVHMKMGSWESPEWQEWIAPVLGTKELREKYD